MSAALPVHEKLDDPSPWGEVALVYRRMCVLRANGHSLEAARVQSTELSRALGALRAATAGAAGTDERLQALFAAEEERVVNARALAELLVPLLSGHWDARGSASRPPPAARSGPAPTEASPRPAAPSARPAAGAPGIADFIDEMLVQDRAAAAARRDRRAS